MRNRCGWIHLGHPLGAGVPFMNIPWAPARSDELREIAKLAPLAILSTELGHGETRREALTSASLGAAKDHVTLAASKVMATAKRSHAAAFGKESDKALRRHQLRKNGVKRTSRAAAMRTLLKKRRGKQGRCARQNGWNLHKKEVSRARRNAFLRVTGLQDPALNTEVSTRWKQLPVETKAYYSIQAKHMNANRSAPPPPDRLADPAARSSRSSNWGMGDESGPISPSTILRARKDGSVRSDAVNMFKANHCSIDEPAAGLDETMDIAKAHQHIPCSAIGICRHVHRLQWAAIAMVHRILQRELFRIRNKQDLQSSNCLLCLHGWKPGWAYRVQFVVLVGMQVFAPRYSILMRCTRPEGAQEQIKLPPELLPRRDAHLLDELLPPIVMLILDAHTGFAFQHSMALTAVLVEYTKRNELTWKLVYNL